MFQFITDLSHTLLSFIKDDPVRPEISTDFRVSDGRVVAALTDEEHNPEAMVCVSFHDFVPEGLEDLKKTAQVPTTVVFYSVWSYKPGSGRELLIQAMKNIKEQYPTVTTFVTLSPHTVMARRFHVKNFASVNRTNEKTVNYLYP
jgi:hypothetical protein